LKKKKISNFPITQPKRRKLLIFFSVSLKFANCLELGTELDWNSKVTVELRHSTWHHPNVLLIGKSVSDH